MGWIDIRTDLNSDDSRDFARYRHRSVATALALHGDRLLGDVCAVFGILDHRLRLAVLVHGDGDDFLLQQEASRDVKCKHPGC